MFGWKFKTPRINYRTSESSGAYNGGLEVATHGLVAGTRVASMMGWRGVESLAKGDMVLTFDNGMQEITDIHRVTICLDAPETDQALWPVLVPPNALGNKEKLTLLPDQGVMLECEAASDVHGDPFAVVAAKALVGERGIHRSPPNTRIELIAVSFAEDQVIYAEGGALILCLSSTTTLDRLLDGSQSAYEVLSHDDAIRLVECFAMELNDREDLGFPAMAHTL
jgi:hypothetical protein